MIIVCKNVIFGKNLNLFRQNIMNKEFLQFRKLLLTWKNLAIVLTWKTVFKTLLT